MRNIIVTGGSRGLGLGIARTLTASGYRVIAVARKETSQLVAAIKEAECSSPDSLHFVPFDLSDMEGIRDLVRNVRKSFGPIYGLVNNAGISVEGVLSMMHDSKIAQLVHLNTLSPLILSKYVVRSMMTDNAGGRIVNIASITGFTGYSGLSVYATTKASLIGFTKSLAREVGTVGINVNAVAPGFVDTDMTSGLKPEERERIVRRSALRRLAAVNDVANSVEFLLGDKAANITGTVLTVDAGSTA